MALNSLVVPANEASSVLVSTLRTSAIVPALSQVLDVSDGGLGNALWDLAGERPALDIPFSAATLLDRISGQNLLTSTRTTTKAYIGADGQYAIAAINELPLIYDPFSLRCLGIQLEPARSNVLLNSETLSTQTVSVTAQAYTLSFYGTGTVELTGAATATLVGTGVYPNRATLTFTPTTGSLTVTVTGSVRYANLENGAFATSWMPTASAQFTRQADVVSIGGTNFSNIYNAAESTVYLEATPNTVASNGIFASLNVNDGTGGNRAELRNFSGNMTLLCQANSVTDAQLGLSGVLSNGVPFKGAFVYKPNFVNIYVNGLSGVADTSFTQPAHNRLSIGATGAHIISRIVYWGRDLATKAPALTT